MACLADRWTALPFPFPNDQNRARQDESVQNRVGRAVGMSYSVVRFNVDETIQRQEHRRERREHEQMHHTRACSRVQFSRIR